MKRRDFIKSIMITAASCYLPLRLFINEPELPLRQESINYEGACTLTLADIEKAREMLLDEVYMPVDMGDVIT